MSKLQRTALATLATLFVVTGTLAATIEASSAHGHHHHHRHHHHHGWDDDDDDDALFIILG